MHTAAPLTTDDHVHGWERVQHVGAEPQTSWDAGSVAHFSPSASGACGLGDGGGGGLNNFGNMVGEDGDVDISSSFQLASDAHNGAQTHAQQQMGTYYAHTEGSSDLFASDAHNGTQHAQEQPQHSAYYHYAPYAEGDGSLFAASVVARGPQYAHAQQHAHAYTEDSSLFASADAHGSQHAHAQQPAYAYTEDSSLFASVDAHGPQHAYAYTESSSLLASNAHQAQEQQRSAYHYAHAGDHDEVVPEREESTGERKEDRGEVGEENEERQGEGEEEEDAFAELQRAADAQQAALAEAEARLAKLESVAKKNGVCLWCFVCWCARVCVCVPACVGACVWACMDVCGCG